MIVFDEKLEISFPHGRAVSRPFRAAILSEALAASLQSLGIHCATFLFLIHFYRPLYFRPHKFLGGVLGIVIAHLAS